MEKSKKKLLTQINEGEDYKELIKEGSEYYLKVGKNVIDIKRKDGKIQRKVLLHTGTDSKVEQSLKDETDIKTILAKYKKTGQLYKNVNTAIYGDFSTVPDYQEAQNILIRSRQQFDGLKSDIRKKFDNDPAKFLQFCNDPKNTDEMVKLGILVTKPIDEPIKVVVTNQEKKE